MKTSYKYILIALFGALLGIIANRNREYLINAQFLRDHFHFRKEIDQKEAIGQSDKVMVCLAFGQSNAANYGNGSYTCRNKVYNYYKGEIYQAKEPLLGPDGAGCSVWTRVADLLIDSGLYKQVVIVPIGIGSTPISCWAEGKCNEVLVKTLSDLKERGIRLTDVFWDQGETDNVDGTTKDQYKARLKKIVDLIRKEQPSARFFASVTGYFPYNNDNPFGIDEKIRAAQTEAIQELKLSQGPDTDSLNLAYYRADAVHFTEKGLDQFALSWFRKIKAAK